MSYDRFFGTVMYDFKCDYQNIYFAAFWHFDSCWNAIFLRSPALPCQHKLYLCNICICICICAVFEFVSVLYLCWEIVIRSLRSPPTRTICILSAQTFIFSISYLAFSIFDIYNCTYFHPSSLDIWCIVYISDTWYFEAQPDHEIIREFDKPNGLSDCYDGSTGLT